MDEDRSGCQLYNDGTPIPLFTASALFNDLYLTSGSLTGNKQSCTNKVIQKVFIQQESVCQEVYFVILEPDVAQSSSIVTSEKYLYESPVSDNNNKCSSRIIVYIRGRCWCWWMDNQSINQSTGDL